MINGATVAARPYSFQFNPASTALMVIDMQRDFLEPGGFGQTLGNDVTQLRHVIAPTAALLAACRAAGVFVVHTREGHRPDLADCPPAKLARGAPSLRIGDPGPRGRILIRGEEGHDIIDELAPELGEPVVDKPGKGAFYATNLDDLLAARGIRSLVVTGVTTEVCVHTTVREANDRGYECLVLEDCVGSYFPDLHRAGLQMIVAQGGIFGWVGTSTDFVRSCATAALPPITPEEVIVEINRPDVVAEVTDAFDHYEKALVDGDNDTVAGFFWPDQWPVRFGLADQQHGFEELMAWRRGTTPSPGRQLHNTVVTTFGTDAAVVNTCFTYSDARPDGRQSQTWVRSPRGWRIVAAHVSATLSVAARPYVIHQTMATVPAVPSTVTSCPVCSRVVASPVPTTAGMPYSRATREAWAARVPPSVTTAAARANSGVHAGAVAFATSTSPSRNAAKSSGPCTMRTGPVARPADAGCPTITPSAISRAPRACCTARSIDVADQPAPACPASTGRPGDAGAATLRAARPMLGRSARLCQPVARQPRRGCRRTRHRPARCAPAAARCSPRRRAQARRTGQARVKSRACSSRMTA